MRDISFDSYSLASCTLDCGSLHDSVRNEKEAQFSTLLTQLVNL